MAIKALAFDLEGTVVDVESAHHWGHLAVAKEFGLHMELDAAYTRLPHFIGGPDEKVCQDIWELLPMAPAERPSVQTLLERDKFHYKRFLPSVPIRMRPGFLEFFTEICKTNVRTAIGSLTPEDQAVLLLERSGLAKLFPRQLTVLREDVREVKPAPDVFEKTASRMEVATKDQLVFEDSPRGIRAALAAGSKAVGMPVVIQGATVGALVDAGASRIFFDWREINPLALITNLS